MSSSSTHQTNSKDAIILGFLCKIVNSKIKKIATTVQKTTGKSAPIPSLWTHQTINKDAMILGFLPKIAAIEGKLTLKELLRAFRHLILCAQFIVTTFDPLNFLCLVAPATLWGIYSQQAYTRPPIQPENTQLYHPQNTQVQNSMIREA